MTATPAPPGNGPWPELHLPSHWRVLDFISDLHLQADDPATFSAWQHHMASSTADAVFVLGDLFEVWVGDDALSSATEDFAFERACAQTIAATARHRAVYFMQGNRDFLVGSAFAQRCQLQLLADPTVLPFGGQRWLLAHGDALCLDDTAYMAFRSEVRQPAWQQAFLAKPLAERRAMARAMREQSAQAQRTAATDKPYKPFGDVHPQAVADLLAATGATTLLHGHTHLPATHDLGHGRQRVVLSDWDAAATPPRAEVLRLTANHNGTALQVQRLPVA